MCYSEWSNDELKWELENLNMELDCGGLSYDQEMYLISIGCKISEEIDNRNK